MDKVQLFGKASVKRGDNIIQGEYISYDANAEYAEVMGGKKTLEGGPNSGRVRAIIQPKNKVAVHAGTDSAKPIAAPAANKATAKDARLSRTLQVSPEPK
jgi:lipopolysaccharide export system protein LptA